MTRLEEDALRFVDAVVALEQASRGRPDAERSELFSFVAGVARSVAEGDASFASGAAVLAARVDQLDHAAAERLAAEFGDDPTG